MTVEELVQELVKLCQEGKGKLTVSTTFFDGEEFFGTWPDLVEFNEPENEVDIKAFERRQPNNETT